MVLHSVMLCVFYSYLCSYILTCIIFDSYRYRRAGPERCEQGGGGALLGQQRVCRRGL